MPISWTENCALWREAVGWRPPGWLLVGLSIRRGTWPRYQMTHPVGGRMTAVLYFPASSILRSLFQDPPPFPADVFPRNRMCTRVAKAIFLLDYRAKVLSSFTIDKYELLYLQYTYVNFREIKKTYAKYHFYCALLYVCAKQIFFKI